VIVTEPSSLIVIVAGPSRDERSMMSPLTSQPKSPTGNGKLTGEPPNGKKLHVARMSSWTAHAIEMSGPLPSTKSFPPPGWMKSEHSLPIIVSFP
jgi:hypothetical protein